MKDKKKVLIGILSVLVCIMTVGYALLAQELTINGSASIDSTWKVEITNITSKDIVGGAVNKVDPTYTATTANFSVGLTQPGDSITYDITVTNKGTLDAVVESINVDKGDNPAIVYTTSGLKRGTKLAKNNGTNTLTVKVDYDSSATSQPTSTTNDITVTINYQQDLGQIPEPGVYSIGDIVEYAGSNWYVIKNTNANEDYVSLIKERNLISEEIGNSYLLAGFPEGVAYYWSDTCHDPNSYMSYGNDSYESSDTSLCTNDYSKSKVKEVLNNYMNNYLDASLLKEVDGYKIRLITLDELTTNFNFYHKSNQYASWYEAAPTTPSWIYNNYFSGTNYYSSGYWTMSPNPEETTTVDTWCVNGKKINSLPVVGGRNTIYGVRPVINLLKSAIE